MSDEILSDDGLSDETRELRDLRRRVERLTQVQREMEARLWTLEDSRVFRLLQRIAIVSGSITSRLRRAARPGSGSDERELLYRSWLEDRTSRQSDISTLPYQPRFELVEGSAPKTDADYFVFLNRGASLTANALRDLSTELQQERHQALYGDEDGGSAPLFKPGWSPELLSSPAYWGNFLAVSRDAFSGVGEFTSVADLAQRLAARNVRFRHVPKILVRAAENALEIGKAEPRKPRGTPLASIVICSRDGRLLKDCLNSIDRETVYPHREIVVVEHVKKGQQLLPGAGYTRVEYTGRFNFAAMNNLGAKAAKGDVLVFLNDDAQPLSRGWLEALVAQAQRPEVGAAGALLFYPNGAIQHAGIVLGIGGYAGHPRRGKFDAGFWPWIFTTRNVSAVTGACLAVRRSVFEQLEGFDLKFPVNYNDVDFCLRAREAGYQVILEAAAHLRHFESRTRARGVGWEELDLFAARWGDQISAGDPFFNPNLSLRNEDCDLAE